jgi:hypothetical protein
MMLSDLLAQFDDETTAADTILSVGGLKMIAALHTRAEAEGLELGAFASCAVWRYAAASDDEWVTLLGELARSNDPGFTFVERALIHAMCRSVKP